MTTYDILRRPVVNEAEMVHVVQDYIKVRKGVNVPIVLGKIDWGRDFSGKRTVTSRPEEVLLLNNAFAQACEWFALNPDKVPA